MNHHVNELGVCVKENEWQWMEKDGGSKGGETDVLLFVHLIPKLSHIFPIGFMSVPFAFSHSVISLRWNAIVAILHQLCDVCVCAGFSSLFFCSIFFVL